ncbi:LuxR C-terminal-related transcriptional regulator [Kitasatospora sp. NPDC052896]|uniref:LuxR C-terminal-related transcriptional regulator n=1 Tax=Kitasatospora sp. NPDC052896 TaxID=3364061 RepID=UPI0037C6971E
MLPSILIMLGRLRDVSRALSRQSLGGGGCRVSGMGDVVGVNSAMGRGAAGRRAGRAGELADLLRLAKQARGGAVQAVLVRGPAGIGRTSLLNVLVGHLSGDGVTVRRATGRAPGGVGEGGGLGYRSVRELFGLDPATTGSGAEAVTFVAQRGVHRRAVELLAAGPLALVLDDAHWCDEESLRCVHFLLRRAAPRPLLVLLSQRTACGGPGTAMLGEILALDCCTVLELGPLSEAETGQAVDRALGGPADERFVRRCSALSGGNPLLLERLLTGLRAARVRPDVEGLHRLRVRGEAVVAESVRTVLAGQSRQVRQVARALAVLGHADPDLLGAVCAVGGTRLALALETLRGAEVIGSPAERPMGGAVRAAVLADLPAAELERLRARAARVLNDAGRPAAEVADQLALLSELTEPWMLTVLREAAAEAPGRATARAAVRYLRRALAAELTGTERRDVRIELARASAQVAPATALRQLRQALQESTGVRERASLAVEYGQTALGSRYVPEAVRVLDAALTELRHELGADPTPADRELCTTIESALLVTAVNEKSTMAPAGELARSWPVPRGDSPAERQLLSVMSAFAALDGRPAGQAVALARRAMRVEETTPAGWEVLASSLVLGLADEVEESVAGLTRALSNGLAHYEPWLHLSALSGRSLTLHGVGDLTGAATDARAAVAFAAQGELASARPLPAIALSTVLLSQGEAEQAGAVLDRIRPASLDRQIWEWHHYLYTKGRLRRAMGDLDGAVELWRRCGRSLAEAGVTNPVLTPWWLAATTTLAGQGRAAAAADIVAQVEEAVTGWGTPRARGLGLVAAGTVAEGRARTDLLAEAVEVLAGSPARLAQAEAEYRLGRELLRRDDLRGARRHLRQAIETATLCGYHLLSGIARQLLADAGGRMPQIAASPLDSLTRSERRIATLARTGVSNREIAEALFITPRTVEMHLTNIYRKLDVRGRTGLAPALGSLGASRHRPRNSAANIHAPSC